MIRSTLQRIASEYGAARRDPLKGNSFRKYLRDEAPAEIIEALRPALDVSGLQAKGVKSIGRWAHVAWVSISDPRVSKGAESGAYVVFLFSKDLSKVFLAFSLGIGKMGNKKLQAKREALRTRLGASDLLVGPLPKGTLGAKGRPERYEQGTIFYQEYSTNELPSEEALLTNIARFITILRRCADEDLLSEHATADQETPLSLIGSWRHSPDYIDEKKATIATTGSWASWFSFPIKKGAGAHLKLPFYVFINVGKASLRYRYLVTEYQTTEDSKGMVCPWPEHTELENRGKKRAGHKKSQIFRTWFKVSQIDELAPPLREGDFQAARPWSGLKKNLFHQSTFGYIRVPNSSDLPLSSSGAPTSAEVKPLSKSGRVPLASIQASFSKALAASGLSFGARHQTVSRTFLSSLATKRFVILTGLSGSGKTQIAMKFGEWLCPGNQSKIVPVRPDWTGPEAVLGYEDALRSMKDGKHVWHVPKTLQFMLSAAADQSRPYLLILDEMNLAHVERYFADILSGMESQSRCIPDLYQVEPNCWVKRTEGDGWLPVPQNLFIVGTVNVDETTYMFSPKVLDRANTIEFRVESADLDSNSRKPIPCSPAPEGVWQSFLAISQQEDWHSQHPARALAGFQGSLRSVHKILSEAGFEFGHRVFYEAARFAAIDGAAGGHIDAALDLQVLQKVLPRLHGSRKQLEQTLVKLSHFCWDLSSPGAEGDPLKQDPLDHKGPGKLPLSSQKLRRMLKNLRANQFTSFTD